jgi:hypothetical protein
VKERLDLLAFEEPSFWGRHALDRVRRHLLGDGEQLWAPPSKEVEEGARDRQAVIARATVITAALFAPRPGSAQPRAASRAAGRSGMRTT